ncbi:MAG: hypothetical protein LBS46_04970 [Dysgonamonadaceae bacterium]|jgi:hypothetical protein|nr:hypothetical protein [Dysgonamonadaceae bacterium]
MKNKKYVSPAVCIHRVEMEGLIAQTARASVNNLQYTDYSEYPTDEANETTRDLWGGFE